MISISKINDNLKAKKSSILKLYKSLISAFYISTDFNNPIFNEWENYFIYCYGNLKDSGKSANEKKYISTLSKFYEININNEDIHKFMYVIQSTYMFLLKVIFTYSINEEYYIINSENIRDILNGAYIKDKYKLKIWEYDFDYLLSNNYSNEICDKTNTLLNEVFNVCIINNFDNEQYFSDEFTKLYELLFPKEIRHSLGEYYTPSWLAKDIINQNELKGKSFIDPTCGSGVFLETILKNKKDAIVYGFDLNPIAVLTSKLVLYLNNSHIENNVFENDILMYPDLVSEINLIDTDYKFYIYGKQFNFPSNLIKNKNELIDYFKSNFEMPYNDDIIKKIYLNKISQRIEALFINNIDIVVGNPPWINWEYLPEKSKKLTKHIWIDYNLFSQNGKDLAFSKEDISLLVTYIAIDKMLKKDGLLAFVLRIGSFKSKQNGIGFRNFKIGVSGPNIKVLKVEDYSNVSVFPGAINTSCVAYFKKGLETKYPLPYYICRYDKKNIVKDIGVAKPTTSEKNSLWLNTTNDKLKLSSKILGENNYKARTGVFTGGANAVYWIKIKEKLSNGNILIENYVEKAKRKAEKITAEIETGLVYKLCRGFELNKNDNDNIYIICPHTVKTKMSAINMDEMIKKYPKTYDYLCYFKDVLDDRKGFASWEKNNQLDSFYAIQRIGEYTFKKYKVAWKYISKNFNVSILSCDDDQYLGNKLILPSEKIMYVSLNNYDEAAYLAGILNSKVVRETIESFMTETSISTHVLDKIYIEDYNSDNKLHKKISESYKNSDFEKLDLYVKEYYNI